MSIERVLVANRGEIARRLIRQFRAIGVETVSVFSEPEADAPWVDEADYAVYLNGSTLADTYLNGPKLVSMALDAACDAIHPGYCFMAERPDFYAHARSANLPVLGADQAALERVMDWSIVRKAAHELGIPLIPASDPLSDDDDGIAHAARLGLPLFVKAVAGGVLRRVDDFSELGEAIAVVREAAGLVTGNRRVYLERVVDRLSQCGIPVVGDRHGTKARLGRTDGSLQVNYRSWIEEMGADVVGKELDHKLGKATVELAARLGWVGVGRVRYAITPHGGWYLLGFSGRLTTGFNLAEEVYGVDLVQTQLRLVDGDPLSWDQADFTPHKHAVQARVFHVDPRDGRSRPEGVLERLVVPHGVSVDVGVGEGQVCTPHTEPLIAKITVTAPSRQAALVRLRAALEELVLEGVANNREMLLRVLGDEDVWRGRYDASTMARFFEG